VKNTYRNLVEKLKLNSARLGIEIEEVDETEQLATDESCFEKEIGQGIQLAITRWYLHYVKKENEALLMEITRLEQQDKEKELGY